MSPERSNAYRRVMKTLEDVGPSKLLDSEQQRIRYAADNLIFAADLSTDVEAQDALADVVALCDVLTRAGAGRSPPRAGWPRMCRSAGRSRRPSSRPP